MAVAGYQSSVTPDIVLEIDQFEKLQGVQKAFSVCYTCKGGDRFPLFGIVSRILHVASDQLKDVVNLGLFY